MFLTNFFLRQNFKSFLHELSMYNISHIAHTYYHVKKDHNIVSQDIFLGFESIIFLTLVLTHN